MCRNKFDFTLKPLLQFPMEQLNGRSPNITELKEEKPRINNNHIKFKC